MEIIEQPILLLTLSREESYTEESFGIEEMIAQYPETPAVIKETVFVGAFEDMLLSIDSDAFCPTQMEEEIDELMSLPCEIYAYKPMVPQKQPVQPAAPQPVLIELDVDFDESIEPPESTEQYAIELGPLRLDTCDMKDSHSMVSSLGSEESMNSRMKRFNQEMKILSKDSPCTPENAIFTRVDESRSDLYQSLVSGPVDTPYAYGLYLFDIVCGESFPQTPPSVHIMTTGDGAVRFNPNLYSDGYVCLSIIGTWSGGPEESWDASRSTILQVLMSIQALVMDNEILAKEPSFEYYTATDPENLTYSYVVKYGNVRHAMLDMIKSPPKGFEKIVRTHFNLNREKIIALVDSWLEEAANVTEYTADALVECHNAHSIAIFREQGYHTVLKEAVDELKVELDKL